MNPQGLAGEPLRDPGPLGELPALPVWIESRQREGHDPTSGFCTSLDIRSFAGLDGLGLPSGDKRIQLGH